LQILSGPNGVAFPERMCYVNRDVSGPPWRTVSWMFPERRTTFDDRRHSLGKTHCARMDHGGCALLVGVKENRIVQIKGIPKGT
jgi:hypothetical protein